MSAPHVSIKDASPIATPGEPHRATLASAIRTVRTWISAPRLLALVFLASLGYVLLSGDSDGASMLRRFGGADGFVPVADMPIIL